MTMMMMMKKSRIEVAADAEVLAMANCLDLLSRPRAADRTAVPSEWEFGCKTCKKRFRSFQALGGHMASHKRIRTVKKDEGKKIRHECPVCGLVFGLGQALGGHMRKHRADKVEVNGTMKSQEENMDGSNDYMKGKEHQVLLCDLNVIPQKISDFPDLAGDMSDVLDINYVGNSDQKSKKEEKEELMEGGDSKKDKKDQVILFDLNMIPHSDDFMAHERADFPRAALNLFK
ncbi:unnamed protein product [Cuscuta europaea]|uniref:C2H2-type domain-containing protein n=1 Tax=Cuscuta europaea TaxID=41803 RepID=A0A9P1E351_CUSEU|nr:unnamed protein product [Cuscuta europaea]